jgi:anti-sigma regulatory factor (Ser/Thr protein kinase)
LIEIATNVIRYAYPPVSGGNLEIRLRLHWDRLEALLTDRGQPFVEPETIAVDWSDELPESGLGLSLARRALDRLEYDRDSSGRNHWWLVKLL